jgi:hypothetical protein
MWRLIGLDELIIGACVGEIRALVLSLVPATEGIHSGLCPFPFFGKSNAVVVSVRVSVRPETFVAEPARLSSSVRAVAATVHTTRAIASA